MPAPQLRGNSELAISFLISANLPFLEAICWQVANVKYLTPLEMLQCYESGWHYRDVLANPSGEELAFIKELSGHYHSWLLAELGSDRASPENSQVSKTAPSMFQREFHQKILTVLGNLNVEFLRECRAYFGRGTLVSLQHGEYRLSKDIDFMCPVDDGYRLLRQKVAASGYDVIFAAREGIALPREIQANQYGIRFPVLVGETAVKFEIVCEGRISLGEPDYPSWSSVPCLNQIDCFAEKLLANADRWLNHSVNSRDLIDLAVQRLAMPIPEEAIAKAEGAYPAIAPLKRAIEYFQNNPDYRDRCYEALSIEAPKMAIDGIDLLARDFGMQATARTYREEARDEDFFG